MTENNAETAAAVVDQNKVLVTDARGRVIAVHRLNALQIYRLTKALNETSRNLAAMDLAVIASSVRRIDTTDFAFPAKESDVEFLMQMLDFDGLSAAGEGLKQLNDRNGTEAAKNLASDPISA